LFLYQIKISEKVDTTAIKPMYPWVDSLAYMLNKRMGKKITVSRILCFEYQNMTTAGISIIAIKLDKEFGFPRVPIIPFVLESHLKKSNLKYCNKTYKPFIKPARTIPFSNRSMLPIFTIIDDVSRITMNEKKVITPSPLPILPKMSCSIGEVLLIKIKIPSINNAITSIAKVLLNRLVNKKLVFFKIIGSNNKARQKRIMTFGTINESLFKPGVMASAIEVIPKTNTFVK
jgi:hypothetical protein